MKTLTITRAAIYGTPHSELIYTYRGRELCARDTVGDSGVLADRADTLRREHGFTHFVFKNPDSGRVESGPIPAYPLSNATHSRIQDAMARAFFLSAFADQCDETGHARRFSGRDYAEELPATVDNSASHAAVTLCNDITNANYPGWADNPRKLPGFPVVALFLRALAGQQFGETLTPELFGHYCAMQSIGHGVGLFDYGVGDDIRVPYVEFGAHSLQRDYWHETTPGAPVYRSTVHAGKPAVEDTARRAYLVGYSSQIDAMNAAQDLNARHYSIKGH